MGRRHRLLAVTPALLMWSAAVHGANTTTTTIARVTGKASSTDAYVSHRHYDINCTTLPELNIIRQLGTGGHRHVHLATFRGVRVVVKTVRPEWLQRTRRKSILNSIGRELRAFEQLRHPSTPKLLGFCLDDELSNRTYPMFVESLLRWFEFYRDEHVRWANRVHLVLSGLDMIRFWRGRREPGGRSKETALFFWDLKPANFGADHGLRSLKVLDMETMKWGATVDLEEENQQGIPDWKGCKNATTGCWPRRQWQDRPKNFPDLAELRCKSNNTCGLLDHRTLLAAYCYHVVYPLLNYRPQRVGTPQVPAYGHRMRRFFSACMHPDPAKRPTAMAAKMELEEILAEFQMFGSAPPAIGVDVRASNGSDALIHESAFDEQVLMPVA